MAKIGRNRFLTAYTVGNYSNITLWKSLQEKSGKYHDQFWRNVPKRPFLAQNGQIWTKNGQKWPNLAEPDFSQHIHQVIIVIEHCGSLYRKNQANLMTSFGEMSPKGHFWPKMAKFGPKMVKTGFFCQNPKTSLPYPYNATTLCKKLEKSHEQILRSSSDERTNERTNRSEFIGPISASRGTKKQSANNKKIYTEFVFFFVKSHFFRCLSENLKKKKFRNFEKNRIFF